MMMTVGYRHTHTHTRSIIKHHPAILRNSTFPDSNAYTHRASQAASTGTKRHQVRRIFCWNTGAFVILLTIDDDGVDDDCL